MFPKLAIDLMIDALVRDFRQAVAGKKSATVEWFGDRLFRYISLTMRKRTQLATAHLKAKIVANISVPVVYQIAGPPTRSKFGEFPRQDTGDLMRSIHSGVRTIAPGKYEGFVGTSLFYGVILENSERLNRTYLKRTLEEESDTIHKILTGPMF